MKQLGGIGVALCLLVGCATGKPGLEPKRVIPSVPTGTATEKHELSSATRRAADWFEAHRNRPPMLRAFVQRMPKGGDIHTTRKQARILYGPPVLYIRQICLY